jgi:hypothetical protein
MLIDKGWRGTQATWSAIQRYAGKLRLRRNTLDVKSDLHAFEGGHINNISRDRQLTSPTTNGSFPGHERPTARPVVIFVMAPGNLASVLSIGWLEVLWLTIPFYR